MAKCARCGINSYLIELDVMGHCPECAKAHSLEQQRKNRIYNLDKLVRGDAGATVQRTFDTFVKQYPDALIVGVSKQADDLHIIIHLDGGVDYLVTFDPLINSVHVEKFGKDTNTLVANQDAPAKGKTYGGAIAVSVLALLYGVLLLLFNYLAGFAGIISSIITLAGALNKSRSCIVFGGLFYILPLLLAFPFSILYAVFMLLLFCAL